MFSMGCSTVGLNKIWGHLYQSGLRGGICNMHSKNLFRNPSSPHTVQVEIAFKFIYQILLALVYNVSDNVFVSFCIFWWVIYKILLFCFCINLEEAVYCVLSKKVIKKNNFPLVYHKRWTKCSTLLLLCSASKYLWNIYC